MAIRTILAAVSGGSASDGALDAAFRLAKRFDAHVEAVFARADERQTMLLYGDGLATPIAGDLLDRIAEETDAQAAAARKSFDTAMAHHGLPVRAAPPTLGADATPVFSPSAEWREEEGYAPDVVATRAQLVDLVVLGRSERVVDAPHSDTIEDVVLRSGRPVLLAPARPPATLGERVTVGWNGTPEAARALVGSMPFLATAKAVNIVSITGDADATCTPVVDYLAWHGIAAKGTTVPPGRGVGPGEQLLAMARDQSADLLVIGGWSHTPWRQLLFGGATRELVATSLMPLLLAH